MKGDRRKLEQEKVKQVEDRLFPLPDWTMNDLHGLANRAGRYNHEPVKMYLNISDYHKLMGLIPRYIAEERSESNNRFLKYLGVDIHIGRELDKGRYAFVYEWQNGLTQTGWIVTPEWAD